MRSYGTTSSTGSSPLARGTPTDKDVADDWHRFIPARAGNTSGRDAHRRSRAVHPRSRGEHEHLSPPPKTCSGSSPLARGTHRVPERRWRIDRFIPARAGNTGAERTVLVRQPVHPRSRGEHGGSFGGSFSGSGSSPLARGTPPRLRRDLELHRFIPARAGNTSCPCCVSWWATVHPRSRGEHLSRGTLPFHAAGSSPLARGTPPIWAARARLQRFIPARAGNTRGRCRAASS